MAAAADVSGGDLSPASPVPPTGTLAVGAGREVDRDPCGGASRRSVSSHPTRIAADQPESIHGVLWARDTPAWKAGTHRIQYQLEIRVRLGRWLGPQGPDSGDSDDGHNMNAYSTPLQGCSSSSASPPSGPSPNNGTWGGNRKLQLDKLNRRGM